MPPLRKLLFALTALAMATLAVTAGAADLSLEPCRLQYPNGLGSIAAHCGRLPVAEDRGNPGGRRIELAVAVVPAISARAKPDPLFLLAGGPGQGARESYAGIIGALSAIRRERDLVLVDQRGTGDSNPMRCDFPLETLETPETEQSPQQLQQLARDCLAKLPGDPRFYTTSEAVRDLEAVRSALGYERINLYGGSYGTRVAQHYLRRYPDRVRTVVLDGVVDPALALGPSIALDAEASLRAAFERCNSDVACAEHYPQLPEEFAALRAALDQQPAHLRIPDPLTAKPREVTVSGADLAAIARLFLYSDSTTALLPLLIHEARVGGNFIPLAAQTVVIREELTRSIATGMHNTVVCSEDLPRARRELSDRDAVERTFLRGAVVDTLEKICEVWPRGPVDPDFNEQLNSSVPALLLSGQVDPVTPPANAARAAAGFHDAAQLVFRGQGHIQLTSRCAQSIIRRFLDAGTASGLDTRCVQDIRPAPFFLSFNGGSP
jgi:pimeloyl-ACP methyl ester carboxylesterase